MHAAALIPLALAASIGLLVFGLGVSVEPRDVLGLVRRPGLLLRSLLAMHVAMPLATLLVIRVFELDNDAVVLALLLLAVSPTPPFLPNKLHDVDRDTSYVYGLLTLCGLLAIGLVPLSVSVVGRLYGHNVLVAPGPVAAVLAKTIFAPLLVGQLARLLVRPYAQRIGQLATRVAMTLLALGAVAILAGTWRAMLALVGDGTVVAIAVITALGLGAGHLLGGPDPDDRTILAVATVSRHPMVAIAVASAAVPQTQHVAAAVLLALLVASLASMPYVRRRRAALGGPARPRAVGP